MFSITKGSFDFKLISFVVIDVVLHLEHAFSFESSSEGFQILHGLHVLFLACSVVLTWVFGLQ